MMISDFKASTSSLSHHSHHTTRDVSRKPKELIPTKMIWCWLEDVKKWMKLRNVYWTMQEMGIELEANESGLNIT